jgi:cellobiose phosphorylase
MLSQMYAKALLLMAELSTYLEDYGKSNSYKLRYETIKQALNEEAWDGNWYVRCFDDEGQPIGSKVNGQGKIFTNAQSWALIADIADEERTEALVKACDDELLTLQGYKLLAPTFLMRDDHIGRISCLEPGVCENGTIYSHVNVWMILGLLKKGKADQAYNIFKRITPGYVIDGDYKENCPPYVFANCYYGDDHRNNAYQMEFTWVTGSVAWYYHVILNEMLGAKAGFDGLEMAPCIPSYWEDFSVDRYYRGSIYKIHVHNPKHKQMGLTELRVDGHLIKGNKIPEFKDGKVHEIDVVI